MRIVHVALRYPPATGGVETYVQNIVERTRNIDEERDVRVLTTKMRTHGPVSYLEPDDLLDDPPYVQRLFVRQTPVISYPRLQTLQYYIGHHKPDIIEAYSFWYHAADGAARYARKKQIPFIFHPMYYENKVRQKMLWRLYAATTGRRTFAAADVVVVISPFERQLIEKAGFPVKRFELVPPGLDLNKYKDIRTDPFAKRGIQGEVLLSVGRLSESKGFTDVLEVLPDLIKNTPTLYYVIAGEDFGYGESLKLQAKHLGIQDHVYVLGKLSDEELIGAYQHCKVFVHPSHYEAFGIVLTEASACRKPIVARNSSAIPYAAPHNVSSLLFNTKDELRESLIALLKDTELQNKLGGDGHAYVCKHFDQDVQIKKLVGLYKELGSK